MIGRRFDNTCSKCQAEKRGTYDLPVRCTNCGASGIGVFSKGHESYYSESCPDCECQTLRVNHSANGPLLTALPNEQLLAAAEMLDSLARDVLALTEENTRLQAEMCRCEKCGHVQADPNWCHKCGHRTSCPEWATKLLGEIDAARKETEDAEEAAERVAATLRQALAFYADLDTYRSYDDVEETWPPEIREDKGKLARAALAAAGDTETGSA